MLLFETFIKCKSMKKIIMILLSAVCLASCSLIQSSDEKDIQAIAEAEQSAKERINEHTNQEIARSKKEISDAVISVISKADTTLTKKFQQVKSSLNNKAEKTKQELDGKIQGIEDRITKAFAIGIIGIAIGIIGGVIAIIAYRKRPRTNLTRVEVKGLIVEEVNTNAFIRDEIRRIASGQSSSYRPQASVPSQAAIDRAIEAYIDSKKFKNILQQYISSPIATPQEVAETFKIVPSVVTPIAKPMYQIYAKESNSMVLSSIQDTYQKGKSIYRLTMSEPNASTAEVSICIEQEEVKQRILKFDSQYLEPICTVVRSSNGPTEVIIKASGVAERVGDDWKVIKPITVEIK